MSKTPTVLSLLALAVAAAPAKEQPRTRPAAGTYWVGPMKALNAEFKGTEGHIAQFGDSITYSMAFWKPMSWSDPSAYLPGDDGLPSKPPGARWRDVIKGAGNEGKGPAAGNFSGWRVGNLLKAVPKVLAAKKPEAAIIMVGTNDVRGNKVPKGYKEGLEKVVRLCLEAKCIPILNTIPPMRGRAEGVAEANRIIKEIAGRLEVPLVDYHAAILRRRPGTTWDGTLIAKDGVHPTAGKTHVYTEENLKVSGYALRNWVNFLMVRRIYFTILEPVKK